MATYVRESSIGRERARQILEGAGLGDLYDADSDYYLSWDADGGEYLTEWGQDAPLCRNNTTTSWIS